jgi:hypothetical protein
MFMAEMIGLGYALLPIWVALRLPSGIAPLRSLGLSLGIVLLLETLTGIVVLCAAIWTVLRAWKSWSKADRAPTAAWALLLLIGVATGVALFFVAQMWLRHPPAFALFAFLRGSHLGSGVSPLMPMVFLSIAGFSVMACLIWRVFLLEDRPLGRLTDRLTEKSPFLGFEDADGSTSFRGVSREENSIVDLLEGPLERLPGGPYLIGGLVFAFFYFGITRLRTAYSVDGLGFDILFMVQAFMVYGVFSLSLLRFVSIWIALRRLLRRLYFHPTRYSYKDIQLASSPHHLDQQNIRLFEPRPSLTAVEYCLATVRQILRIADESDSALSTGVKDKREELEDAMREVEAQLTPGLAAEADLDANQRPDRWAAVTARADAQKKMAELSKIVVGIFERVWRLGAKPLSKVVTSGEEGKPSADERLLAQVELFIAVRVVDFLRQIFPQLMNLVGFSMAGVVAMMLAVSAYPFPASETLLWFGWVVLVLAILTSLSVFVGINRNPILSMITGTEPGHFNWDSAFTLHLLMFGIIPVLTLLGAQYPHALSGTFSWIGALFGSGAGGM